MELLRGLNKLESLEMCLYSKDSKHFNIFIMKSRKVIQRDLIIINNIY